VTTKGPAYTHDAQAGQHEHGRDESQAPDPAPERAAASPGPDAVPNGVEAHRISSTVVPLTHQRQIFHVEAGLAQRADGALGGGSDVEDKEGGIRIAHDLLPIQETR